jgi:2-phosphoglycerate kinase
MLRRTVPQEQLPTELFWSHEKHVESGDIKQLLKHQNAESDALWPYLVALIHSYVEDNYDLLVEGVAILPSLLHKLDIPHRAVIIGNDTPSHAKLLTEQALANQHDWLHEYTPQQIERYSEFFSTMNDWLREEAHRYDVSFISLHDDTFESDLEEASHKLVG